MRETTIFRVLSALLVAAVAGVYAIALIRDNGEPKPGGPQVLTAEEALSRLSWAEVPKPLPDITFDGPEGRPVSLAEFRGRVVLVNFWATWCQPCLAEMAELDKVQATLGGPGFAVVAVSVDRKGADAQAWLKANNIAHLAYYNDSKAEIWTTLGMAGLPMSLIVDAQGREVARLPRPAAWGSDRGLAILRDAIVKHGGGRTGKPTE